MAAACGGDDDAAPSAASTGDHPAEGTHLTVRHFDGERLVGETALDCAAGDPRCAAVVDLLPELRPDPDEVCTQIYGGPERLVVDGVVDGEPVTREVTRRNGCEIDRYERLSRALEE